MFQGAVLCDGVLSADVTHGTFTSERKMLYTEDENGRKASGGPGEPEPVPSILHDHLCMTPQLLYVPRPQQVWIYGKVSDRRVSEGGLMVFVYVRL